MKAFFAAIILLAVLPAKAAEPFRAFGGNGDSCIAWQVGGALMLAPLHCSWQPILNGQWPRDWKISASALVHDPLTPSIIARSRPYAGMQVSVIRPGEPSQNARVSFIHEAGFSLEALEGRPFCRGDSGAGVFSGGDRFLGMVVSGTASGNCSFGANAVGYWAISWPWN